jgi:hypothetical protein
VRVITHDDGLIKNANGHIAAGPMPDLPSQPELGRAQPRLNGASGRSKVAIAEYYRQSARLSTSNRKSLKPLWICRAV